MAEEKKRMTLKEIAKESARINAELELFSTEYKQGGPEAYRKAQEEADEKIREGQRRYAEAYVKAKYYFAL